MKKAIVALLFVLFALPVMAQTQGEAVEELVYIFQHSPREVAVSLVAGTANKDATGEAFKVAIKHLLLKAAEMRTAESRSGLTEADRAILKAAKADAMFDPVKVFPERIAEPTRELKLDTAISEVSKE